MNRDRIIRLLKSKYMIWAECALLFILLLLLVVNRQTDEAITVAVSETGEKKYIKWVEFDVCYSALDKAYQYDVQTYGKEVKLNWIELLAYLGTKYGGNFKSYKEKDMVNLANKLLNKETTMEQLTCDMKYYTYYYEAYEAVLGGLVGEYEIQIAESQKKETDQPVTVTPIITEAPEQIDEQQLLDPEVEYFVESDLAALDKAKEEADAKEELIWVRRYGLKAFSPIAREYYYYDYDDFGSSRSYGYRRKHLGHDMMSSVGTPIIAVESGYVEALGWNMYGGWRLGIRSFDGKRYYYYAHMRKNFPYNKSLQVGSIVTAGDVIGYVGRTGYSRTENTNNIETSHLHFGLQLIFDESQKEGNNEIWVDCYALTKFLYRNRSLTVKDEETKEYSRVYDMHDPAVTLYTNSQVKQEPLDTDAMDGIMTEYGDDLSAQ